MNTHSLPWLLTPDQCISLFSQLLILLNSILKGKRGEKSHRALHWNWSSDADAKFSKSKRIVEPCTGRCPILVTTWTILKFRLESTSAARCSHWPVLPPVLWWRALARRCWSISPQWGRHILESWGPGIQEAQRWRVFHVTVHPLHSDSGHRGDSPTHHLLIRGKMLSPSRGLEPKGSKSYCQPLEKEMGKSTNAWEQDHGGNE